MSNPILDFTAGTNKKHQENICIARVITSVWHDSRGVYIKKSLNFLKRKSVGFNVIDEDCSNIGVDEVVHRIINFNDVPDGIYRVITCDESRDWETGAIEDWNYKLIEYGGI